MLNPVAFLRASFGQWRASCKAIDAALFAGFRLAILGRPTLPAGLSAGTFWALALLAIGVSGVLAWLAIDEPRQFNSYGVQTEGFGTAVVLFACFVVTRAFRQEALLWPLATLVTAAGLVAGTVIVLFQDHLLKDLLQHHDPRWYYIVLLVSIAWWIAIWRGAMSLLAIGPTARKRASMAASVVVLLSAVSLESGHSRLWTEDYRAEYDAKHANDPPELIAEEVFERQPELLDEALARLRPRVPGQPNLYFVSFGPYGDQDVFLNESLYASHLFETRFGAAGRTLTLVNNRRKIDELPLATVTNLERSLDWIGDHMKPEEDILFLFLTSHGSRDAELSISLDRLSFRPLTADVLADLLAESGIRWKVLVVSACYSGSFVNSLRDDHTLVITAARADRTSFGCADDAEFTNFGRAYFVDALGQTRSFVDAFDIASRLVHQWELRDGNTPSEPQIAKGRLIETKLKAWATTLPPLATKSLTLTLSPRMTTRGNRELASDQAALRR